VAGKNAGETLPLLRLQKSQMMSRVSGMNLQNRLPRDATERRVRCKGFRVIHHSVNASVIVLHFECVVTVVRRHEGFDRADARLRIDGNMRKSVAWVNEGVASSY